MILSVFANVVLAPDKHGVYKYFHHNNGNQDDDAMEILNGLDSSSLMVNKVTILYPPCSVLRMWVVGPPDSPRRCKELVRAELSRVSVSPFSSYLRFLTNSRDADRLYPPTMVGWWEPAENWVLFADKKYADLWLRCLKGEFDQE